MNTTDEIGTKRVKLAPEISLVAGRECSARVGVLRTKPGRNDCPFSSSMSCSDKIASWNVLGIQGGALAYFIPPIYLSVILVGDAYDSDSLNRALIDRTSQINVPCEFLEKGFKNNSFDLRIVGTDSLGLCTGISDDSSMFWFNGMSRRLSSLVLGFKKGSKKPIDGVPFPISLQSPLSRQYIFEKYFCKLTSPLKIESYEQAKIMAREYQHVKKIFHSHPNFSEWIISNGRMKKFRQTL